MKYKARDLSNKGTNFSWQLAFVLFKRSEIMAGFVCLFVCINNGVFTNMSLFKQDETNTLVFSKRILCCLLTSLILMFSYSK
jgi:hypothetical protein